MVGNSGGHEGTHIEPDTYFFMSPSSVLASICMSIPAHTSSGPSRWIEVGHPAEDYWNPESARHLACLSFWIADRSGTILANNANPGRLIAHWHSSPQLVSEVFEEDHVALGVLRF